MKKYLLLFAFAILFSYSASATLLTNETFENYTAYSFGSGGLRDWQTYYDLLVNQSGGMWNCTTASQYPTCLQCHDCYSGTYGGYAVYPSVDDSSQFLYIWSLNGTYSSSLERYYSASLRFNHTNGMNASLYGSDFSWVTKFRFRLMNYEYGAIFNASHPLPLKSYYGFRPIDTGLLSFTGSTTTWVRPRGGDIPLTYPATSGNFYDYPSWRAFFPSTIGTQGTGTDKMVNGGTINEPRYNASDNCQVTDQFWHNFELYQYFNSTRHIQDVEIYLDGVLCSDGFLGTGSQLAIGYHQDYIDFETSAIFGIAIDDIRIYDNFTALDGLPECNDGIDNDGDGVTDYPLDPSCSYYTDDSEFPADLTFQCFDGTDNDGDGFVDYPADDGCVNATDNDELPYKFTACNNGVDDDGDGLIDIDDPSCGLSKTGTTELPAQVSQQPSTPCYVQNRCVLKDEFEYTDNITLHGWWGNVSNLQTYTLLGSKKLKIFTNESYSAYLNKTNPNIYSDVVAEFEFWASPFGSLARPVQSFYLMFKDDQERDVIKLRFDLKNTGISPFMNITVNNMLYYPVTNTSPLWTALPCTTTECSIINADWCSLYEMLWGSCFVIKTQREIPEYTNMNFRLEIDQILKEYDLYFLDEQNEYHYSVPLEWSNTLASKIDHVVIENINLTTDWYVYIDNLGVHGALNEYQTTCTEYEPPYYLKEEFNGYPNLCGWVVSDNNVFFAGTFLLYNSTPRYFIQKEFDTITETTNRYTTIAFDMNLQSLTYEGNLAFRLYDTDDFNFFSTYIIDGSSNLWYSAEGTSEFAYNISLATSHSYKFIIDSQTDTFDLYVDGTQYVNDGKFSKAFYNLHEFNSIKLDSRYFDVSIDNLVVYSSDSTGNAMLPTDIAPRVADNETSWCGLFRNTQPSCTNDGDCVTGDCMPNNKCNHFDMTYCDENGYTRGNKCLFAGMSSCFFESTTNIIFDNFFWVIILMLILMAVVYLSILLRRRG